MTVLREYLDKQIAERPIERKIIERIANDLRTAGTPIVKVWDSEEWIVVDSNQSILDQAFNLDELSVFTADGHGVFLVMGQDWDMIADYHVVLEPVIGPIIDWVIEEGK